MPAPAPKAVAAPVSVAKAKAKGKAKAAARKAQLLAKSVNSLHAVARLLGNEEFLAVQEMIDLGTSGLFDEHNDNKANLKSQEAVLDHYAAMADGEWHKALYPGVDAMTDLSKLAFVGFTVELPEDLRKTMAVTDSRVAYEDGLAAIYWRVLTSVMEERCLSMHQYSSSYPQRLGALNSKNALAVERCVVDMREDWESYVACRRCALPATKNLALRSGLNSPAMASTFRIARASGYKLESPYIYVSNQRAYV
jgi:hypothetical protein